MKHLLPTLSFAALCGLGAMADATADYSLVVPLPNSIQLTGAAPYVATDFDPAAVQVAIDPAMLGSEGYKITIGAGGITAVAGSEVAAMYARNTLAKALPADYDGGKAVFPAAVIADAPRFPYRGMHLDVARHFFPVDFIKSYIDMLALHNMNTFHFHLTDDQGWRIESKRYPKLNEIGSYRDRTVRGYMGSGQYDYGRYGGYYTQHELRDIVAYAQERGITVIPEIDMPGHMLAALAAYPELGCTGGPYEVCPDWGIFDDVLCIGNDQTMDFLKGIFEELIEIFPSKYIHIGGDECPRTRWHDCPKCQARIKSEHLAPEPGHTPEDMLQSWCTAEIEKLLNAHDRQIIGWDEILDGEVAPGATVMSWQGTAGGIKAAKMGHDVVMTPNSHCYFDFYQTPDTEGEPLSIGGCLTLEKVYGFDPVAGLSPEQAQRVKGVQANLWTEYIATPEHVEYMALPRMAALSEVQWCDDRGDYDAFTRRAAHMMDIYAQRGWSFGKHIYKLRYACTPDPTSGCLRVALSSLDNAPCRFTTDGSKPTASSPLCDGEILIDRSCTLRVAADRGGDLSDEIVLPFDFNLATLKPIEITKGGLHPNYTFHGPVVLADGRKGGDNFAAGGWLGFPCSEVEATIDLGQPTTISHIDVGSMHYLDAWIMGANDLEVWLSLDGQNYTHVEQACAKVLERSVKPGCDIYKLIVNLKPAEARYVRVALKGEEALPQGHPAAGQTPFIFLDEIYIANNAPLPITGTWVNLFYQDERNKYMNPADIDMTDPDLWSAKVAEMADLGIECLVFMAVANEGLAAYPSALMPHCYPEGRKSPVDAIMDAAAERGMKVFMSSGWAKDQDDNLRLPEIKNRQIEMMDELAAIYGSHPAMHGWYLPVEDCLGPVLSEYAVEAVNHLTDHARALTPGKKIMVSPYGIFISNFDDPAYADRIRALKVDIIAYQDEVGCEREPDPLHSLRCNWPRLKAIHKGTDIEIWANCELFAWEKETNSRTSALIPAPLERVLDQMQAATDGGVQRIISFAVCGIWDAPQSKYPIGLPIHSRLRFSSYRDWINK